jgi:hypothetical protein
MDRRGLGVVVLVGGLVAACTPAAPPFTPAHRAAVDDSVREVTARLAAEISAHGYRAFVPVMDSAPGYVWAYNGFLPFTSFDSMATWARSSPEPEGPETFAWDSVRIEALAPGLAAVAATYSETAPDRTGNPGTERGVFTAVAVHRADGWKFTDAHTSTLPPPPPPAPARRR